MKFDFTPNPEPADLRVGFRPDVSYTGHAVLHFLFRFDVTMCGINVDVVVITSAIGYG